MIIPSGAGGGYDTYTRTVSAFLEKRPPRFEELLSTRARIGRGVSAAARCA